MRQLLLVVMFAILPPVVQSATVVWDSLDVWLASQCYLESDLGYPRSLSLGLEKTSIGNGTYSYRVSMLNLMFAGNWAQAYAGDIVGDLSFANDERDMVYTESCDGSFVTSVGASAVADVQECMYLMFKCGYVNPEMEIVEPVYGWVSFGVDLVGSLSYMHSAWDLDGGAMIVGGGAVPEPSCAVLLLLGCAGLLLRRSDRGGKERVVV